MGCENEEQTFTDVWAEMMGPEGKKLRKANMAMANQMLGKTATPLPGDMPLSAPTNQLQLNAAQIMNQMMGGGDFGMPPYRTASGLGGSGGTGGGGGGGGGGHIRYGGGSGGGGDVVGGIPFNQVDLNALYGHGRRNPHWRVGPAPVPPGTLTEGNYSGPGQNESGDPMAELWNNILRQNQSGSGNKYRPQGYR